MYKKHMYMYISLMYPLGCFAGRAFRRVSRVWAGILGRDCFGGLWAEEVCGFWRCRLFGSNRVCDADWVLLPTVQDVFTETGPLISNCTC